MIKENNEETQPFEVKIGKLESLVKRLEQGDISLEEGLASFEEGISLIKSCQQQLDKAAQKIQVMTHTGTLSDLPEYREEA